MGKHNKARRPVRGGQIVVAAAAATVLAGWAAPIASADNGGADAGTGASSTKNSNPVSKAVGAAAGAAKDAVDNVRKAATDVGSQLQNATKGAIQTGSGGAGSLLSPRSNGPRSTLSAQQTTGGTQRNTLVAPALVSPTPPASNDTPTGSVTIPIADVTLPNLPELPDFQVPGLGLGVPPSFGAQGPINNRLLVPGAGALTNGNNLFGLNFFNIEDNNLGVANNIGTGLQGILAGDRNTAAGNQVILPSSFGSNFGLMGNDNGQLGLNLPTELDDLGDLQNLNPLNILALGPSGTNLIGSAFSYGNNTFIMGDDNQGTGNNIQLGAGNFGNNMHFIGDNADFAGNNIVTGLGSFGNNMSVIGDRSGASGNNTNLGLFGFANNIGLIGSAASGSGNNTNVSPFGGFAQNFVLVGDGADGSGNNSNISAFSGFAQNIALIGSGADGSGNNSGIFNFALVGSGVENAGNNSGGFNFAIFPGEDQNCTGPACFNFFGAQFGN